MAETRSDRIPGKTCRWVIFGSLALLPLAIYVSPTIAATPSSRIDFDGDGKTDFAVWRPSDGKWYVKLSGGGASVTQWGDSTAGDIPVPGDYDGDGKTDFAVWRPSDGKWYVKLSGGGTSVTQWGDRSAGDIPVPGDYDGDGKADFAVWRPSNGTWCVKPSSGVAAIVTQWGNQSAGDIPVVGDFDGDGKTDFAVWRPSNGTWYVKPSSGIAPMVAQWGDQPAGDIPVPGDYDGDGKTDFAVWRPSNGMWYVKPSFSTTAIVVQWGDNSAGDKPVIGDFDGDGKTDFAVWRSSNGTWYVKPSSGIAPVVTQWGDPARGDKPVNRPVHMWGSAQEFLDAVNQARSVDRFCGATHFAAAPPVAWDYKLAMAAYLHSFDMATNHFFSHTGSDGSSPGARITREGYDWASYGENIAVGYPTVSAVIQAWLGSEGHCMNIMDPGFEEIGAGFAEGPFSGSPLARYWTLDLASPR